MISVTLISSSFAPNIFAAATALRCQVDSLDAAQAHERNRYVKTCFPDVIWKHATLLNGSRKPTHFDEAWKLVHKSLEMNGTRPLERPSHYTPVFLASPSADHPIPWTAPKVGPVDADLVDENTKQAFCNRPENVPPVDPVLGAIGFQLNYRCISSCFAPEVRVFFADSYIPMEKAFEVKPEKITVLSEKATFDNMSYRTEDIDLWTTSIRSEPHTLRNITTGNGHSLRVTPNHPLVTADGYMRLAQDIKPGDSLVHADGTPAPISSIKDEDYFGKVYNVQPKGKSAKGNIIIAEGFLSGSNFIQNEGYEFVNERIFRSELPLELVR